MVPSDTSQATALADIIRHLGWSRVALISTSYTYGAGLSLQLFQEAKKKGFEILQYRSFQTGLTDFTLILGALADIKRTGARVIVGNFVIG